MLRDEFLRATAERIHLLCLSFEQRSRSLGGAERDAAFNVHVEDIVRVLGRVRTHNDGLIEK